MSGPDVPWANQERGSGLDVPWGDRERGSGPAGAWDDRERGSGPDASSVDKWEMDLHVSQEWESGHDFSWGWNYSETSHVLYALGDYRAHPDLSVVWGTGAQYVSWHA